MSVHIETRTAATAASTAFPPASANLAPASAANWDPEAIPIRCIYLNLAIAEGFTIGSLVENVCRKID